MTQFLISDTHFGHGNIIELGKRPFEHSDHMTKVLIDNWNKVVQAKDVVFHLGDFGWRNVEYNLDVMSKLRGTIVLIGGNHDGSKALKAYHMAGIQIQDYYEVKGPLHGVRVCLFHYPMSEWNGYYQGAIHCHGHTHSPIYSDMPGRYNVAVEAIGYAPKPLKDIEKEHFELLTHMKEKTDENHIRN